MNTKALNTAPRYRLFPDDETCLQRLFDLRFGRGFESPACGRPSNWYRINAERAHSCQWCGDLLHPTVGTAPELTRAPLQLWIYSTHLFMTTRHGVGAK